MALPAAVRGSQQSRHADDRLVPPSHSHQSCHAATLSLPPAALPPPRYEFWMAMPERWAALRESGPVRSGAVSLDALDSPALRAELWTAEEKASHARATDEASGARVADAISALDRAVLQSEVLRTEYGVPEPVGCSEAARQIGAWREAEEPLPLGPDGQLPFLPGSCSREGGG